LYIGYDEQHPPAHTPGAISERGPATPWNHEDYEFPPSVGPVIYLILIIKLLYTLLYTYIFILYIIIFILYLYLFITNFSENF